MIENDSNGNRYLRILHELLSVNAESSLKVQELGNLKQAKLMKILMYQVNAPESCIYARMVLIKESENLFPKPLVNAASMLFKSLVKIINANYHFNTVHKTKKVNLCNFYQSLHKCRCRFCGYILSDF